MSNPPEISEENFAELIRMIEDGEMDIRMTDLSDAIQERQERRKTEIERLVQSVWGPDARVIGGRAPAPASAPLKVEAPVSTAPQPPPGHYLGQDGNFYELPEEHVDVPQPGAPIVEVPRTRPQWPPPAAAPADTGPVTLGVAPVRDPMGGNFGDGNSDIVSTGAQIERYSGG